MFGRSHNAGDSFGELLRRHRAAAGLSQEALAARSGITKDAISMLERGVRSKPRNSTVVRLARALRLSDAQLGSLLDSVSTRGAPGPRPGADPPAPGAHFVGRERELGEMARRLRSRRALALHGLAGVGKTQIAAEYLHRHRAAYPDGVFWIHADRAASLFGGLLGIAWRLGLPERREREQERQVEAVRRWLGAHPSWLLVLDDLEPDVWEAVRRRLAPEVLPGHLLATSRTPMWPERLALHPLSPTWAARFLLRRTGQSDRKGAAAVAEALGGLPLALEQAAAYVEVSGRDLASYAVLLRTRLGDLMGEGKPADYAQPVSTTWRLTLERVEGESRTAVALLGLCAFLGPDDIPAGILVDALRDELELDRAVAGLRRYSLVERQDGRLRMHRLLQALVRESLDGSQRRRSLEAAIQVLRAGFPVRVPLDGEGWTAVDALLPHVGVVERLAAGLDLESEALAWLLDQAGRYLSFRGELHEARPLVERGLALRRRLLGPDHPDTATSLTRLATLLRIRGEVDEAVGLHRQALAIRERALGPDHLDTAESVNNLAHALLDLGEVAAGVRLHERALRVRERVLGPAHLVTASSLSNLALGLMDQGQLAEARGMLERAACTCETVSGPGSRATSVSLAKLAAVLRAQGEPRTARTLIERALAIQDRVLGPRHHYTAWSLSVLASVLRDQGEIDQAERVAGRVSAIRQRALAAGGAGPRWPPRPGA